jgi:tight adherence protein B
MMSFSQLMLMLAVFSFMMTAVNLLPSVVRTIQERYKGRFGNASRELDKFFVHMKVTHVVIGSLVLGAGLTYATGSWALGIAVVITGVFAPKIMLAIWKEVRSAHFDAQLMDALILINNAMRSGLDIATGIELVATNMKPPISEEFGLVLNGYRLGTPLESSLQDMTQRVRSRILETTVTAVIIQRETGGNLIRTFEQLVQTIREETKLQQKVKAVSAQGRTQIVFLAAFPWVLGAGLYFISPEMMRPALESPTGQLVLIGLVIWEVLGIIVTKRVVTVDV